MLTVACPCHQGTPLGHAPTPCLIYTAVETRVSPEGKQAIRVELARRPPGWKPAEPRRFVLDPWQRSPN